MSSCWRARVLLRALLAAVVAFSAVQAHAATASHTNSFSFAHTGEVSSGVIAVLGTFTNTTSAASPELTLPQFDPALGRLSKATVTVTTSISTFVIRPTGVLSLVSGGSATRKLRYDLTAGATTGTGSNELTNSAGTLLTLLGLGGGDIGGAPLANTSPFTNTADLHRFTGTGTVSVTVTATNTLVVSTLVSLFDGAGLTAAGVYAGTVSVTYDYTPWALSGYVYRDADHNGFRSANEAGTPLTLYAKLLSSPTGPVLQTTPVHAVTGLYAFAVSRGNYRVLIDDNASTGDISALQPPIGWSATQAGGMARDVSVTAGVYSQDFGLTPATLATGKIFRDTGTGAGVANNGVPDGGEVGLHGRQVQLLDAVDAVLDLATTANDGTFRLYVPSTVANGAALRIRHVPDHRLRPTGASAGTTAGAYSTNGQTLSFVFANSAPSSGIALGFINSPTLSASQQQFASPGAVVFHGHKLVATTVGRLTVTTSRPALPELAWSDVVYHDVNGNGRIDAGEPALTGGLDVVEGQTVSLLLKVSVPQNAAGHQQLETVLKAEIALANAAPALSYAMEVTDLTIVLPMDGASVVLTTAVSTTMAAPGSTIVYTLTFSNPGPNAVRSLEIADVTPPYTTFLSSTMGALPAALTVSAMSTPAIGANGVLRWAFDGELAPGASGTLQYTVRLSL